MSSRSIVVILITWLAPTPTPAWAWAPAASVQVEVDVPLLIAKALEGEVGVDSEVFEIIASARSRMALNGLMDCCDRARVDLRPPAYFALRHFAEVPDLESFARSFLTERALGDEVLASRAAARSLVRFGAPAHAALERVVQESDDEQTRRWAIGGITEVLAARATPDALELLLDHYRPYVSGTAELGARALSAFKDTRCTKTLHKALTRSKTAPEMRAMIASAIALHPGKQTVTALRKALRDKDTRVLVAAIDALHARGETGHLDTLDSFARSKSPAVRFAAFRAVAIARQGSPEFEPRLRRVLDGKDFALRMGAAAALGLARDAASAPVLAALIDDDHSAVRRVAIEAARDRRIPEALPHLIARMEQDGPRLRALAYEALVELTGLDHGPTVVRWSAWWTGEAESFELPERAAALAAVRERRAAKAAAPTVAERASFYGVRFATDRVVFVLDISGSMREQGRLERMKRETLTALEEIPDGARFNLVFFEDEARPWGKRLVQMTKRNRRAARQSIFDLRELGGTNLHAGLRTAFADPDVETIVVLSDGEPTEGVTRTESILRDVRLWNELRGIVVHSVAVGWDGSLLEAISAETGGETTATF